MNRSTLLAELAAYRPLDPREARMTRELADFVATHVDGFERTQSTGHVTASAWIVDESLSYALLTHHRKLDRWLQLGGHADGDEDVRRVALREAREESGLTRIRFAQSSLYDIDIHRIPARGDEPAHNHYDVRFAFIADRSEPLVVSAESHELAWIALDRLAASGVDDSVLRLAHKTPSLAPPPAR